MGSFRKVALLHSHPMVPLTNDYYVSDLVELCGLAAIVRDHVDDIWIPVTPADRNPLGAFRSFLKKHRPDFVGISCFTCSATSAFDYARTAKEFGAFVVTGGYHPSARPEEMLASDSIDLVVRGEGEWTFRDIIDGRPLESMPGISYRENGRIVHNPDRPLIADLDALPLPLRSIRPSRFGYTGLDYHADTIYTSRGCRGKCAFCANHLVGKAWRQRSIDSVFQELMTIPPPRRRSFKWVKFWDPCFLTDAERIEDLCRRMIDQGLQRHFRFIAETRAADVIRARDIIPLMREAGFARIGCGVESPNRQTHKTLNKGLNLNHVQQAADLLVDADIMFSKFLIIGHETEDETDILRYSDFALSIGVDRQNTTFFIMTPYPGTALGDRYEQAGMITSSDWDLYTNFGAVIAPKDIDSRRLQTLHCGVSAHHSLLRRFKNGSSFSSGMSKLFEVLFTHTKMMLLSGRYTAEEVENSLWEALAAFDGTEAERPARAKDRGRGDVAVAFHAGDRAPVVIGLKRRWETETLRIAVNRGDEVSGATRKTYHVSCRRLTLMTDGVDYRTAAHDATTLRLGIRGFQVRWIPGLMLTVGRLVSGLIGMGLFHLSRRWRGR